MPKIQRIWTDNDNKEIMVYDKVNDKNIKLVPYKITCIDLGDKATKGDNVLCIIIKKFGSIDNVDMNFESIFEVYFGRLNYENSTIHQENYAIVDMYKHITCNEIDAYVLNDYERNPIEINFIYEAINTGDKHKKTYIYNDEKDYWFNSAKEYFYALPSLKPTNN